MTHGSEGLVEPLGDEDREGLRAIGWLLGEDAPRPLAILDPIEGHPGSAVELRRHPALLLLEHPELAETLDRFQTGARRKLRASDYRRLSCFETCLVLAMQSAHARETEREWKRRTKRNGGEET